MKEKVKVCQMVRITNVEMKSMMINQRNCNSFFAQSCVDGSQRV